jgi:NADH-quinone oxidoreductase subunit C
MNKEEALTHIKKTIEGAILREKAFLGESTIEVRKSSLIDVLKELKQRAGFSVLMDLTGVDFLEPRKHTHVMYWLQNPENYHRLRLIILVDRGERVPTVVDLWEGANWYERELYDLFGVEFEGHPSLRRILMPDDWEGHPLLKDYQLTEEPVEFKHGVKPKVPSEIIPNVKNTR